MRPAAVRSSTSAANVCFLFVEILFSKTQHKHCEFFWEHVSKLVQAGCSSQLLENHCCAFVVLSKHASFQLRVEADPFGPVHYPQCQFDRVSTWKHQERKRNWVPASKCNQQQAGRVRFFRFFFSFHVTFAKQHKRQEPRAPQ